MADSNRELISKSRRLLQNPYAYIEQLHEPASARSEISVAATESIAASRKLLENPYAYLNGDGEYDALAPARRPARQAHHSDREIGMKVREIHAQMWRERESIWSNGVPSDPIDLLDPALALQMIGYDFELEEGLGQMQGTGGLIEVAGLIDTRAKVVRVGRQFPSSVRAFTTAHELAHAVLHSNLGTLHRDKPIDGASAGGERVEVEANKFASLFLMPEKLLRARFSELFQTAQFELTEETSFALVGCSLSEMLRSTSTRRQLSRLLAAAERFNGRHFQPLNEQFRVSRESMAIRLEELALLPVDA